MLRKHVYISTQSCRGPREGSQIVSATLGFGFRVFSLAKMSDKLLVIMKSGLARLLRTRGSRKLCSRVADESALPAANTEIHDLEEDDNGNERLGNMPRGGVLRLLMKLPGSAFACLTGNLKEPALDATEGQISRERMRNSGLQMWFAGEPPTTAERNQLLVDSSMKYAIFL